MDIYLTSVLEHYQKIEKEFVDRPRAEMSLIKIYPNETRQEILGFGGALTESSAYVWSKMSDRARKKLMDLYFGPEGNCYNFCRTHIQSCDFSLGNRSYVREGDDSLATFSIEDDRTYIIPFIKAALEKNGEIQFLASPWSPPAFMKTNGEMNHGGKLKEEYYDAWAKIMVKYVQAYEKEGIPISRMTLQNEPAAVQTWDSCIFSPEEERRFAGFLRRNLDEAGYSHVKLSMWDHNKDLIIERTEGTFTDDRTDRAIEGIAFHWYSGDHFEALQAVREKYPKKELIFTEGCVEYSRFRAKSQSDYAEMYGHSLIGDLNAGMNAFIDWNVILDEQGGPNHVQNFCDAPVMCNTENDTIDIKLSYYYIGHFSRFIKPGARRLLTTRYTQDLECCAFRNPDGEMVLIVMNQTDKDQKFELLVERKSCQMQLKAHSIITACWR